MENFLCHTRPAVLILLHVLNYGNRKHTSYKITHENIILPQLLSLFFFYFILFLVLLFHISILMYLFFRFCIIVFISLFVDGTFKCTFSDHVLFWNKIKLFHFLPLSRPLWMVCWFVGLCSFDAYISFNFIRRFLYSTALPKLQWYEWVNEWMNKIGKRDKGNHKQQQTTLPFRFEFVSYIWRIRNGSFFTLSRYFYGNKNLQLTTRFIKKNRNKKKKRRRNHCYLYVGGLNNKPGIFCLLFLISASVSYFVCAAFLPFISSCVCVFFILFWLSARVSHDQNI